MNIANPVLQMPAAKTSTLSNALVPQADQVTVDYGIPDLGTNTEASVRVWSGPSIPSSLNSQLGKQSVHNNHGSVTLTVDGTEFTSGFYTLGLCVGSPGVSVVAAVSLMEGQPVHPLKSQIQLTQGTTQKSLEVHYQIPTTPRSGDCILVYPGTQTVLGAKPVLQKELPEGSLNTGQVRLSFKEGQLEEWNTYILEYHPNEGPTPRTVLDTGAVSATQPFLVPGMFPPLFPPFFPYPKPLTI